MAVFLLREHGAGQEFQVHLVDDAGVGRDDLEVRKGLLAPAQEDVAFLVALELDGGVPGHGPRAAEEIHLHRVVDHQLGGRERIDALGIAAQAPHGLAHRRQIHYRGDAGEILHQHPRRHEGDLLGRLGLRIPAREGLDVLRRDVHPILVAQQVLQEDLERIGQGGDRQAVFECLEAVDLVVGVS